KLDVSSREEAAEYWRHERRRKLPRPAWPRFGWGFALASGGAASVAAAGLLVAAGLGAFHRNAPSPAAPDPSTTPTATVTATPTEATHTGYIVKAGDSCMSIA